MTETTLSIDDLKQKIGNWSNSAISKEELLQELCSFLGLNLADCNKWYEAEQSRLSMEASEQETLQIDFEQLIRCLKNEQNGRWKQVSSTLDLDEVTAFAEKLIEMGEKYHFTELTDWAIQLAEYVQLQDFQLIEETIASFPGLISLAEKAYNLNENQLRNL